VHKPRWRKIMELSERLKYLRNSKNLTQKTVAAKIGINVRQYQRYENGEQVPATTVLSRLCHFFKVPSGYFLDTNSSDEKAKSHIHEVPQTPMDFYMETLNNMYAIEQELFSQLIGDLPLETLKAFSTQIKDLEIKIGNLITELQNNSSNKERD
jgi:transcriptional regulator with XRE-family HTH domain